MKIKCPCGSTNFRIVFANRWGAEIYCYDEKKFHVKSPNGEWD